MMSKYYVACVDSPSLEYKRYAIKDIEDFVNILNWVKNSDFYDSLSLKEYSNELDTCIDCLGVDIFTWSK